MTLLPETLNGVVKECLAADPDDRPGSFRLVLAKLGTCGVRQMPEVGDIEDDVHTPSGDAGDKALYPTPDKVLGKTRATLGRRSGLSRTQVSELDAVLEARGKLWAK